MKFSRPVVASLIGLALLIGVPACQSATPTTEMPVQSTEATGVSILSPTQTVHSPAVVSSTQTATPTSVPQPTDSLRPTASPTPPATATPDPYQPYTIPYLRQRAYGAGEIQAGTVLAENSFFTRWAFEYDSDGLRIHGFANLPQGQGPFPVVIALHGYIDPQIYATLDYTTRYADSLARAGFVVLHPNLRGYPPSDEGDNLFRVGMAIDVLNLIALVRQQGGQPGLLAQADPGRIGLWGHSMGGGIATRVLVIDSHVLGAVLYGPMSGDEAQNYTAIYAWLNGEMGAEELAVPAAYLPEISPVYYYGDITAAISLHHGREDEVVPLRWSRATCDMLIELGKTIECYYYAGQQHTFDGEGDQLLEARAIEFFRHIFSEP